MSIFTLTAISGVAVGPVAAGWIDMDPRLGWRWIQWIHAMYVDHLSCISHTSSIRVLTSLLSVSVAPLAFFVSAFGYS